MNNFIYKLSRNPYYVMFVILVVMPINGGFIASGHWAFGTILISGQILWTMRVAFDQQNESIPS